MIKVPVSIEPERMNHYSDYMTLRDVESGKLVVGINFITEFR